MNQGKFSFNRILLYLVSLCVVLLTARTVKEYTGKQDIVYADITRLTQSYTFKKDLEKASSENLYRIKNMIDSLEMVKKITGAAASKVDTQIANAKYAFGQYYQRTNEEITKKTWDRLNQAIEQYGKEKNIQILMGANGAGSLLYANRKKDVTEDLVNYVNQKYEKGS